MRFLIYLALSTVTAGPVAAACGGTFRDFVAALKTESASMGHDVQAVDRFFRTARQDPKVLRADRAQGVFQKPFLDFSRSLISQNRIDRGRRNAKTHAATFDRIERDYGISRGVLLAFWAFETDYGSFQGNFNTRDALLTLAHDCRRPELFRPQVFAALTLYEQGAFDPDTTTGAWAGEIGMVQMLPRDILESGVDGDGDGQVRLRTSAADALMSGARMLSRLGWRASEPWLHEVTLPTDMDWSLTGLDQTRTVTEWVALGVKPRAGALANGDTPATILLPQGHNGPAFIAYPNFRVYFEWNQSFVYVMTAAYFATRLEGAPIYNAGNPDRGLSGGEMKRLQTKLAALGHDVGKIDGIWGAGTRRAVQSEQARLGLPADGWPTQALLNRL